MQRCKSDTCHRLIPTSRKSHVRAEVFGHHEYWCDSKCYNDWLKQNLVFMQVTEPEERRVTLYSEHTVK